MEFQPGSDINATPLMEAAPVFDQSWRAPASSASTRQRQHNFTPIQFDFGSSQNKANGTHEFINCFGGETSTVRATDFQGSHVQVGYAQAQPSLDGAFSNFAPNYGYGQVRLFQQAGSSGPMLRRLPEHIPRQASISRMIEEEGVGNSYTNIGHGPESSDVLGMKDITRKLCKFAENLMKLEAARQKRHEESCASMDRAAEKMTEFIAAMNQKEKAKEERREMERNCDLELKLSAGVAASKDPNFNWMFGHGVAPKIGRKRATADQARFDRVKNSVRSYALWFLNDGTEKLLRPPYIQFLCTPRVGIDGFYLKRLLLGEVDVSEQMAFSLVRVLRRDECLRYKGIQGDCHYVIHSWARLVTTEGSTVDQCEEMFRTPQLQYALAGCRKVVAFLELDDGWASVSIDFQHATTLLIHPAVALAPPQAVLAERIGLMTILTIQAQAHMVKLAGVSLPEKLWQYGVALSGGEQINQNESGIATAFYSIPKDGQFMPVSLSTLTLAKETFVYSLTRMCTHITKQPIRKGTKVRENKRHRNGKFKKDDDHSRMLSAGDSHADSHEPAVSG